MPPPPSPDAREPRETPHEDWKKILFRVADGDRLAFLQVSRLITGFLAGYRAFDYESDWDDLVQEVVLSTLRVLGRGELQDRAVVSYLRTSTRNRLIDRFRRLQRVAPRGDPEAARLEWPVAVREDERRIDVRRALEALPNNHRIALVCVHVEGKTYQEAAEDSGIPLGSLKRYLREGLEMLRDSLSASGERE